MRTFLLTYNPDRSAQFSDGEWHDDLEAVRAGASIPGRWSTGARTSLDIGDRVYLLRQGPEPRGIIASGWTVSEGYVDEHFDDPTLEANYVEVEWDALAPMDDPLPTGRLLSEVSQVKWNNLLGSGVEVKADVTDRLGELWREHLNRASNTAPPSGGAGRVQGRIADVATRVAIEVHAQEMLTAHYEAGGWEVSDTHIGNPYDAEARKGSETIYLEAKGTQGPGDAVLVTAGEVRFALGHPGQCFMGIVSGIRVDTTGTVIPESGELRVVPWTPGDDELEPVTLRWRPEHDHGTSSESSVAQP